VAQTFRLGSDIVGQTIALEEGAYEVLGVMPADFAYPIGAVRPTELWVPYVVPASERIRNPQSQGYVLESIARLKAGVSTEQAQRQMDQIAAALERAHPEWNKDHRIGVQPLHDHIVGARTRSWMLMLLGAVGLVLLIACANVANLPLARATTREREIGIRAALGAGRWRLTRQLMIESLLLAAGGTLLAVVTPTVLVATWRDGLFVAGGETPGHELGDQSVKALARVWRRARHH
jgi:putative ABC transport system permease protein